MFPSELHESDYGLIKFLQEEDTKDGTKPK
jgi:hypothetical protein